MTKLLNFFLACVFSSSVSAAVVYQNDFEDPGEMSGFIDGGGTFTSNATGGDDFINGGGASTVRTGSATSEFAAGAIGVNEILTFEVTQRIRDRESYASIVDSSGVNILSIGNTNGTGSLANNQDPDQYRIYGFDGTSEVLIGQFEDIGALDITSSSTWVALRLTVDLSTGAYTLEGQNVGGALNAPTGSYTFIGDNTTTSPNGGILPGGVITQLTSNATGIGAGQSGGGTGFDDFSVTSVTAVPEPSAILALGFVTCVVGMSRRRQRN